MKQNKMKYLLGFLLVIFLSACVNDLDVAPIDPNIATADNLFEGEEDYKMALAKVYGSFSLTGQKGGAGDPDIQGIDEGFSSYLRQYWGLQELPTDEAIVAWNDATIKDFHFHTWTSTDVFIMALYSRIYYTISLANEFIRLADEKLPEIDGDFKTNMESYKNEARFIRALSYWHAIDMFGNVPFVTEEDKPGSFLPEQIQRADLFNYVESELKEIETLLVDAGQNEYGRADKVAVWMLMAKLYLNAEVYSETNRYTDALTYLNKIIGSSYSIDPNYNRVFAADNNESPEIIFAFSFDGEYSQSYGGTSFILNASTGDLMPNIGVDGAWGGYRTCKEFVNLFDIEETDFTTEDPQFSAIADKRGKFYFNPTTWNWDIEEVGTFTHGIGILKFSNFKSDGSDADHAHAEFASTDFPVFRLGDAYLMYAEAVVRGGSGGSMAQAVDYVNVLRERGYGNTNGNISEADLTLDFILDERGRELYWEGQRRTDLIRFNKFTGDALIWEWKGNVRDGAPSDNYRRLYPIPENDMMANPNLVQNKDY